MGSVAAQVASWQRRARNRPGPLGPLTAGSGESPLGPLTVELLVDGQWQVITPYVMTRDGSFHVGVTSGTPNEGSKPVPASCSFQLNNRDGRFSPKNPLSPLYGKIVRNQPLRVSVPSGNDKAYRFWGEVSAWPQNWDSTGTDVWVDLAASGILRRLGQGNSPIGSTMYVALSGPPYFDVLSGENTNPVVAYWPCEDGTGATSIASAISGAPAMVITGAPTLSSFTGFVCSAPLPVMGPTGVFTGRVPTYTPQVGTMVRFLIAVPAAGAVDGQVVCGFSATGTIKRWEVYYSAGSGGLLGLRGRDSTGSVAVDTAAGSFALNGQLALVGAELVQNGANIDCTLSTLLVGGTTAGGPFVTATGQTVGTVTSIAVGGALSNTTIGHVFLQTSTAPPIDDFALLNQLVAYAGETAGDRIARLCALAGVAYEQIGASGSTVAMGAQLSATVLNLIQQAVDADGGILYERTNALGLGYRTRVSMENQPSGLALSYPAANLAAVPVPVDDDRFTRNDITVSRIGGSSARATQKTGALSVLPPPAGVGQYDQSTSLNLQSDSALADQAGWRLHLGTVDEARYPQISINMAHPSFTGSTTLKAAVLALRPGDRITVSGMPFWTSPDGVSQLLLGTSEAIDGFQHRLAFNLQPESPYRVAVADDPVYGRADTDGSVLAADAGPADAAVNVVTTTGGPLWVTTLRNPAEFPFNVRAGGEVMTVTSCSSAITDSFTRTVSSGWGSADTGQAWTTNGGAAADYAVTGTTGTHSAASVNVFRVTTAPQPQADFDVRVNFTTSASPTGDSQYVFLLGRYTDGNNFYFARVQLAPTTGAMTLSIRKRTSAGGEVQLASYTSSLTFAAGTVYWVRLSGISSALSAKLWQDTFPEPDWQTTATDTDIGVVGSTGVRTLLGPACSNTLPVTFTFDAFEFLNVQTMQVTRSVNGVVKPLPAGTDVRLDQPAIAAL